MLRRFSIASLVLLGSSFVVAPALAQSVNSASFDVDGDVASYRKVEVAVVGAATNLDMGGEGANEAAQVLHAGDITVTSNNEEGVKITALGGNLQNPLDPDNSDQVAFKVEFTSNNGTQPATLSGTASTAATYNLDVDDITGIGQADLWIEYDAPALLEVGNYKASITIQYDSDLPEI